MADQKAPTYPEHERLKAISDKSQAIGDFLTWTHASLCLPHHHDKSEDGCYSKGLRRLPTCGMTEGEMIPVRQSIEKQLSAYFEIDLAKLEAEKRDMLDRLRRGQS